MNGRGNGVRMIKKSSSVKKQIGKIRLLFKSMSFSQKCIFLLSISISPARLSVGLLGWAIIEDYILSMDVDELEMVVDNAVEAKNTVIEKKKQKETPPQSNKTKKIPSKRTKRKHKKPSQVEPVVKATEVESHFEALSEYYEDLAGFYYKYEDRAKELAEFDKTLSEYSAAIDELSIIEDELGLALEAYAVCC